MMIDPEDCGSTVGYAVRRNEHGLSGEVRLSDCNRQIEWYFDRQTSPDKIQLILRLLHEFEEAWTKANKSRKKRRSH